jgi:peptidoglycan hydrolase-like protein with peptidoglycan-binding domain
MRVFAEPVHENITPAPTRRRDDFIVQRQQVPTSTPSLLNTLRCVCGDGCSRCNETSDHSALAKKERPEVVVEPKTELKTHEFAASPELVLVMKGKRYVSYGNVGKYVKLIQEALINSEVPSADGKRTRLPKHGVDGIFGPETLAAVKEFQSEYGIAVDGIVGQQTLYWLDDTFRNYPNRPGPESGKKLSDRFAPKNNALDAPQSVTATMKVERTVTSSPNPKPEISAGASFKAVVEGVKDDKVFWAQNIRRIERKIHWQRTEGCTTNCEQARAFIGKAQGLDTELPYTAPVILTGGKDTSEADDTPALVAQPTFNPQGDFQRGDVVTLFAHDQFRMFLAHGQGNSLFDYTSFNPLGFFDWEWKGKVRFTFDGTTWTAGTVQSRTDPKATSFDTSSALVFLGPLYTGDDVETNLNSSRTKVNEKPADW